MLKSWFAGEKKLDSFQSESMDESLRRFTKYIWWNTPDEAMKYPDRIIAQVMDRGTTEDVLELMKLVGKDRMRQVLMIAEPGMFDARSWSFWHYMLTDISLGQVPPLPQRRFL